VSANLPFIEECRGNFGYTNGIDGESALWDEELFEGRSKRTEGVFEKVGWVSVGAEEPDV
jgi:hypothetical protein